MHALLALKGGTAASVSVVFFFTREGLERVLFFFYFFFQVILIHHRFCRFRDCLTR